MQIAAGETIKYISLKDIPKEIIDSEMVIESLREDLKDKPANIREAIIKGRLEKTLKTLTLLDQACLRDSDLTVDAYIKNHVFLLGENIKINRFSKFILGEI